MNQWKQKYEALAKLYAQLRKEHLDLLNKFKEIRDSSYKQQDEARKEIDKVKNEVRVTAAEASNLLVERDALRGEVDRIKLQYEDELTRLRKDLDMSTVSLQNVSKSKGQETQLLMEKFQAEKELVEKRQQSTLKQHQDTIRQLEDARQEINRLKHSQTDESSVLQAGLDQTLIALSSLQEQSQAKESELSNNIRKLSNEHVSQLNRLMDNILHLAIMKVQDAIYEFESSEGNKSASPEYVLVLVEKVQDTIVSFGNSFVQMVQVSFLPCTL